jgi:hypothetical protein
VICLGLLGTAPRGATAAELRGFIRYIAWWARARGIRMTSELTGRDRPAILRTIDTLVNSGLLIRDSLGSTRVYAIDPARHPIASYYRNTVVHHFLDKAIIELSLYKAAEADARAADIFWAETERLRELFKFEFFYLPRDEFKASLAAELSRVAPDWSPRLAAGGDALRQLIARFQPLLGHAVLLPYVESYSIVLGLLARQKAGETLTEQACTELALKEGRQAYLLRRITSEASIGKILFQNAYKLAGNLGLLAGDDAEGYGNFASWHAGWSACGWTCSPARTRAPTRSSADHDQAVERPGCPVPVRAGGKHPDPCHGDPHLRSIGGARRPGPLQGHHPPHRKPPGHLARLQAPALPCAIRSRLPVLGRGSAFRSGGAHVACTPARTG